MSAADRWVAYTSDESGRFEIYVMPFSPHSQAAGRKWAVSNEGGTSPRWSPEGRELFYQSYDRHVQAVSYTVRGDTFVAGKPRVWSEIRLGDTGIFPSFDLAPDGKSIMALFPAEDRRGGDARPRVAQPG